MNDHDIWTIVAFATLGAVILFVWHTAATKNAQSNLAAAGISAVAPVITAPQSEPYQGAPSSPTTGITI
jgi:hypothetical protein